MRYYDAFKETALNLEDVYGANLYVQINDGDDKDEVNTADYGSYADVLDAFDGNGTIIAFECPECGEPVYYSDWIEHDWSNGCPVCEEPFELD